MSKEILFFSGVAFTIVLIVLIVVYALKKEEKKTKDESLKNVSLSQGQEPRQLQRQRQLQLRGRNGTVSSSSNPIIHTRDCLAASDLHNKNSKGVNITDWSSLSVPYLQQYKVSEGEYKRLLDKYGPQYFEKLSQYNYELAPYLYPGVYPPEAGPLNQSAYGCSGFNQPYLLNPPLNYQMPQPGFGQTV